MNSVSSASVTTEDLPVLPWNSKSDLTASPVPILKLGLTGLLSCASVYVITASSALTTVAAGILSGMSIYWLRVNNPERMASYKFKMQEAVYSSIKEISPHYRLADHEIEAIMESETLTLQARMASYLSFDEIRIKNAARVFGQNYTGGGHVYNYVQERKIKLDDIRYGLVDPAWQERQFEKNSTIMNFCDWLKSIERRR